jgi:hypothetical protein
MIRVVIRLAIALLIPTSPLLSPARPAIMPVAIDIRPAILARLERSIARHENCVSWNNPGCLAFAGQRNAQRLANGYARFRTLADGRLAEKNDLKAKLERCMTVEQIARAWNGGTYLDALLKETQLRKEDGWCSKLAVGFQGR